MQGIKDIQLNEEIISPDYLRFEIGSYNNNDSDEENQSENIQIPFLNCKSKDEILSPVFKEKRRNLLASSIERNEVKPSEQEQNKKINFNNLNESFVTPKKLQIDENKSLKSQNALTPLANLKILLHAVSPDIRNMKPKENKFNFESNIRMTSEGIINNTTENYEEIIPESTFDVSNETTVISNKDGQSSYNDNKRKQVTSRKEKSLGLLCRRFLSLYPEYPPTTVNICLDESAKHLAVGRRRIYDIVNVLESVEVVHRVAKNNYIWYGKNNLLRTLRNLQISGWKSGFAERIIKCLKPKDKIVIKSPDKTPQSLKRSSAVPRRRDKSLGSLSQKFIMLFLLGPDMDKKPVSLELAARALIGDCNPDENKYKTKVRRLYDIANVLTSLQLIEKESIIEQRLRKPAFRWIGPPLPVQPVEVDKKLVLPDFKSPSPHGKLLYAISTPNSSTLTDDSADMLSLCQIVEQERVQLDLATPMKSQNPQNVVVTPVSLMKLLSPCNKSHQPSKTNFNDIHSDVDSSFDAEDLLQKEIEDLRKRFPSPMSKLLSACNVQQALSEHKKEKTKRIARQKLKNKTNDIISKSCSTTEKNDSSSPAKLSLTYLQDQQQKISNTVGAITGSPVPGEFDQMNHSLNSTFHQSATENPQVVFMPAAVQQTLKSSTNNPLAIVNGKNAQKILYPVQLVNLQNKNANLSRNSGLVQGVSNYTSNENNLMTEMPVLSKTTANVIRVMQPISKQHNNINKANYPTVIKIPFNKLPQNTIQNQQPLTIILQPQQAIPVKTIPIPQQNKRTPDISQIKKNGDAFNHNNTSNLKENATTSNDIPLTSQGSKRRILGDITDKFTSIEHISEKKIATKSRVNVPNNVVTNLMTRLEKSSNENVKDHLIEKYGPYCMAKSTATPPKVMDGKNCQMIQNNTTPKAAALISDSGIETDDENKENFKPLSPIMVNCCNINEKSDLNENGILTKRRRTSSLRCRKLDLDEENDPIKPVTVRPSADSIVSKNKVKPMLRIINSGDPIKKSPFGCSWNPNISAFSAASLKPNSDITHFIEPQSQSTPVNMIDVQQGLNVNSSLTTNNLSTCSSTKSNQSAFFHTPVVTSSSSPNNKNLSDGMITPPYVSIATERPNENLAFTSGTGRVTGLPTKRKLPLASPIQSK